MAGRAVVCIERFLSGGTGAVCSAKLAEGPLHLGRKITRSLAEPAHVDLIEGGAIEGRRQVTTSGIAAMGLSFRQFFPQCRHPAAEGAEEKRPRRFGASNIRLSISLGCRASCIFSCRTERIAPSSAASGLRFLGASANRCATRSPKFSTLRRGVLPWCGNSGKRCAGRPRRCD